MPDMTVKTRERIEFLKRGKLRATKNIKITVDGVTVYDRNVPTGKKLQYTVKLDGKIENA